MKKVGFFFLFVGMNFSYALDYSPQTLDLVFQSLRLDTNQITSSFCDTIESAWTVKLGKLCDTSPNSIAYTTPVDESVYIIMEQNDSLLTILLSRGNQVCDDPFFSDSKVSGTAGKLQFSEVLYFELLRLQSLGIVQIQRDSLVFFLQEKIALMRASGKCEDIDGVYFFEEDGAEWMIGPGCCSLVDSSTAVFKISSTIGNVQIKKISLGKFQLNGVPSGTAYALFNLNGQLISKGLVGNGILEIPVERAVLKLGGKWFEL